MMSKKILILFLGFILFSCNKKQELKPGEGNNYNNASITILTDDSFKSVTEALAEAYMISYPEAKITVKTEKEDLAFLDLLKGKAKLIVMSRNLSLAEQKEYERMVDLKFQRDNFAVDAVVFVVPKNASKTEISIDEIKKELNSENSNLIFDGNNASNLNFVAEKINQKPEDLKYSIINGNQNLIEELEKYPNKIGVIGLNTISRPYGKEAEKLRSKIKILAIKENGTLYLPTEETLRALTYPFSRIIYFLTNEGGFGIAHGIIRFSCTQLGQIVVKQEGLQPYNIFKREVQMK